MIRELLTDEIFEGQDLDLLKLFIEQGPVIIRGDEDEILKYIFKRPNHKQLINAIIDYNVYTNYLLTDNCIDNMISQYFIDGYDQPYTFICAKMEYKIKKIVDVIFISIGDKTAMIIKNEALYSLYREEYATNFLKIAHSMIYSDLIDIIKKPYHYFTKLIESSIENSVTVTDTVKVTNNTASGIQCPGDFGD